MITVKLQKELIKSECDQSEIKFSTGATSIVGVVRDLLAKCPPKALLYGWHVDNCCQIFGIVVVIDGNKHDVFGRTRKLNGAIGRD